MDLTTTASLETIPNLESISNVTSTELFKENSTEYREMTSQYQDIQDNTATSVDVDDSSFVGTTDSTFEIDELIPVNSLTTRKYRIHPNTTPGPMEVTTEEGSGEVGSGPDNIGELFGFSTESPASGDDDRYLIFTECCEFTHLYTLRGHHIFAQF